MYNIIQSCYFLYQLRGSMIENTKNEMEYGVVRMQCKFSSFSRKRLQRP